ncbi:MAG TPA: DUF2892 domain-containing protein [Candidatus Eisenbacteria bacterium]|nr:DUF2892 domain-containing protein [Candidatus Eisenbacteria bacterium]
MTINEGLRLVAGVFVTVSVALGFWVSPWFLAFTAFVGLNLVQSAFSHWCPMMWLLGRLGMRKGELAESARRPAGKGLYGTSAR